MAGVQTLKNLCVVALLGSLGKDSEYSVGMVTWDFPPPLRCDILAPDRRAGVAGL